MKPTVKLCCSIASLINETILDQFLDLGHFLPVFISVFSYFLFCNHEAESFLRSATYLAIHAGQKVVQKRQEIFRIISLIFARQRKVDPMF